MVSLSGYCVKIYANKLRLFDNALSIDSRLGNRLASSKGINNSLLLASSKGIRTNLVNSD
jgi:hypothetical protein